MPKAHRNPRRPREAISDLAKQTRSRVRFTPELLQGFAEMLKSGRLGTVDRLSVSDDLQFGLRAMVRSTGQVAFHVQYTIGDSRPMLKLGDFPDTSVEDARKLAATVLALAEKGIDPQEGLHARLMRELLRDGAKWKP